MGFQTSMEANENLKTINICMYCGNSPLPKTRTICEYCGTSEKRVANQNLQDQIYIENGEKGFIVHHQNLMGPKATQAEVKQLSEVSKLRWKVKN